MPRNPLAGRWISRELNHADPKKQLVAIARVSSHIEAGKLTQSQAGAVAEKLSRNLLSGNPRVASSSAEALGEIILRDRLSKTQVTKSMVRTISNAIFRAELEHFDPQRKSSVHDLLPLLAHKKLLSEGLSKLAVAEILAGMESTSGRGLDSGDISQHAIMNLHSNGGMSKEHVVSVIGQIAPKITQHASDAEAQDPYIGILRVFTDHSPEGMLQGKIPDEIITWALQAHKAGEDESNKVLRAQGLQAGHLLDKLFWMKHLTPEQSKRIFGF